MARQIKAGQLQPGSIYNISSSYAITASYAMNGGSGGGGSFNTSSLLITASAVDNTITFTKGDGSTFPVTVNTGSGGGGGTGAGFPYSGSAVITGSLLVSGSGLSVVGNTSITGSLIASNITSSELQVINILAKTPDGETPIYSEWIMDVPSDVSSFGTRGIYKISLTNEDIQIYVSQSDVGVNTIIIDPYDTYFTSPIVAPSITSSLQGTASWAENFDTSSIQTQVDSLTSVTSSYVLIANTASMLQPYVLTASTSSMLQPYMLTTSTASMLLPYVLTTSTASMLLPYVLTTNTASMLQPYVLTSTTSSMLQPYVLTVSTSSMLQPYVLTASTASMTVLSSSYATNSDVAVTVNAINLTTNDAESYPIVSYTIPNFGGSPISLRTPGGTSGTNNLSFNPARGRITVTAVSASSFTSSLLSGVGFVGTASWSQTASYVASANVVGPYGANSITSASYAITASYAQRANSVNELDQNVVISGSLTVIGASTFFGSSSFVAVTASQLYISQSYISVNVFEPVQRFGGLYVYDSGSSAATASLTWDSLKDRWVYTNASGSTYSGGMLMSGPRHTGSLGDEPSLTRWFIARSDGGDHLNDTQIFSSASIHQVTGSMTVTAGITASLQGVVTGNLIGTASWAERVDTGSIQTQVNTLIAATSSYMLIANTSSMLEPYVLTASTASMTVLSSSYATTASFAETVTRYTRWHVYDSVTSASIGKTYDYNGYAVAGTALTENAWTITRLVITASGAIVTRDTANITNWYATGSAFTYPQ